MRFKEFLFERKISSLDAVAQQIKANCKPFLKHGRTLYRGYSPFMVKGDSVEKFDPMTAFYSPQPTDRKPRDSGKSPAFNFLFNAGCELAFGEEDIRVHTVFATNSVELAKVYGEVTFFFPAGDFHFLTSKTISDSFEENLNLRAEISTEVGVNPKSAREAFDILASKYKNKPHEWIENPEKALTTTMDAFNSTDEQFYFKLKTAIRDVFAKNYDDTPNLGHYNFPSSGGELLFYQTHGYYSVPAKMVMKEMSDKGIEHSGVEEDEAIKRYLRDMIMGQSDEDEV